jgi:hypothetical protein
MCIVGQFMHFIVILSDYFVFHALGMMPALQVLVEIKTL